MGLSQPPPDAIRLDDWFVLLDPEWEAPTPWTRPPPAKIVGGWRMDGAGEIGPFQANPGYEPSSEDTPTDPLDAVLRLIAAGENLGKHLVALFRDTVVEVGVDDSDGPM